MSVPIDPFKINEAVLDLWRCYIVERDMAKELEAEVARLKAEVERSRDQYNGIIDTQLKVIEDLKTEVERLTSDLQMEKENEDRIVRLHQKANNEVYGLQSQVAALIDDQNRLKAELAKSEEHNAALCERMQDLNSELHTCSCANAKMNMHMNENARLKAEVERLKMDAYKRLSMRIKIDKLNAKVEMLTEAGDVMADSLNGDYNYLLPCVERWNAAKQGGQP